MSRFVLFLHLITLLHFSNTVAQETVLSGMVTDAETGEPLTGVNIYISGTTIGSSTNQIGEYSFSVDLIGKYDLVASFIGFKTKIKSIDLRNQRSAEYNFELDPDVLQLNEINVTASNAEFLRQLDLFKTFFIGFDGNADQTNIINAEVLEFDEHESSTRIDVTASAPLLIYNNALGYIYELELRNVYFNPRDNTGLYKVYPRVEEMEAPNRRTQRRWNSNRKKSYVGSSRHFFKSLIEDRLWRNRFRTYPSERNLINYTDSLDYIKRWFPNNWQNISKNYGVYLLSADFMRVEFVKVTGQSSMMTISPEKVSGFEIKGFPEIVVVNKEGVILNSDQIGLFGHWSDTRFSDFLPLDYSD